MPQQLHNLISQRYVLRPLGRAARCSSIPIGAVPLPNLSSNVYPRKVVCVIVALGMHSSIFPPNISMLDSTHRNDQSVASISLLALSKQHGHISRELRLLAFTGCELRDHFKVTTNPL